MALDQIVNRIAELFDVNLALGEIRRKTRRGPSKAGSLAGYVSRFGYRIICIDYVDYFGHNLIWLLTHGEFPPYGYEVDHKNRIRHDNRPENLRLATRSQNCANASLQKNNTTGYRNVFWDQDRKQYRVQIRIDGQIKWFGRYNNLSDAAKVAESTLKKLYGEFAHYPSNELRNGIRSER